MYLFENTCLVVFSEKEIKYHLHKKESNYLFQDYLLASFEYYNKIQMTAFKIQNFIKMPTVDGRLGAGKCKLLSLMTD
jgi:hypothetical protein